MSCMSTTVNTLSELYSDTRTCARLVGLEYVESDHDGLKRVRHGKGFTYKSSDDQTVTDTEVRQRITDLVIPPAWQDVWICPTPDGHVLATGIDEKGRKQYLYHPKWRTVRDLIKFYRMITFAHALPRIRRRIDRDLRAPDFSFEQLMAAMLWVLDNIYIRIGNEVYFHENESVGLTTLTDKNAVIVGDVVTLNFTGKSGKQQQITFEQPVVARIMRTLQTAPGNRLFSYQTSDGGWRPLAPEDINHFLHKVTGEQISAKDFRTWGGTLVAYMSLVKDLTSSGETKPEKVIVQAVDNAAAVLGNTRSVARASYVHPHLLETYGSKDFEKRYEQARRKPKRRGLDRAESELLTFLESLFTDEFDLLKRQA